MSTASPVSATDELRARISSVGARSSPSAALAFGVAGVDGRLARGGISTDGLHEVCARSPGFADDAAATLFLAGLAARIRGQVLWALTRAAAPLSRFRRR